MFPKGLQLKRHHYSHCDGTARMRRAGGQCHPNSERLPTLIYCSKLQTWLAGFIGGFPSSQMFSLSWCRLAFCRVKACGPIWFCHNKVRWRCVPFASAATRVVCMGMHAPIVSVFIAKKRRKSVESATGFSINQNLHKRPLQTCNNEKMELHLNIYFLTVSFQNL